MSVGRTRSVHMCGGPHPSVPYVGRTSRCLQPAPNGSDVRPASLGLWGGPYEVRQFSDSPSPHRRATEHLPDSCARGRELRAACGEQPTDEEVRCETIDTRANVADRVELLL